MEGSESAFYMAMTVVKLEIVMLFPICSKSSNDIHINLWTVIGHTMRCLLIDMLHIRAVLTATNLISLGDLILHWVI